MSTESKIDKIQEDVSEIKTHLAVYNEQLKIHIKGVTILEQKMVPIETHVAMVNGVLKFIGLVGVLAGIIEVFIKLL